MDKRIGTKGKNWSNLFHLLFLFSALAILVVSSMTVHNMTDTVANMNTARETLNFTEKFLIDNYIYRVHASAAAAQHLLSASDLETLRIKPGSPDNHDEWLEDQGFLLLREALVQFADENGLEFIYYYFRIDNFVQPIIDNDQDLSEAYTPSNQLVLIDPEARIAWNSKEITVSNDDSFVDPDGLITAYAPVFDDDGEVYALVGVDIKDEQLTLLRDQIVFLSERIESLSSRITILIIAMVTALLLLVIGGAITFINQRNSSIDLKDALTEAESASRAKSDFLANMSHEMRTPLNAIIGMTAIGKNSEDSDRKEYSLTKIEEASKHLLGVISDVLDYSKIEAGKLELDNAEFSFEKMLKTVCDVIAFKTAEKNQVFDVCIDMAIPSLLIGDEQHISQVVANLLSNATKFTPENGTIILRARLAGEKDGSQLIGIDVTDTGIGISDEQKSRIFRSFEQADNTITKRFGGTGLGLAISKNIIESMGGSITFESELGKGSTFSVVAPFMPSQEPSAEPPWALSDFSSIKALIVEDNLAVLQCLSSVMDMLGAAYDIVESADAALSAADSDGSYSVCFYNPHNTGFEFAQAIKSRGVKFLIAMLSVENLNAIENDADNLYVDKTLTLPLFPSEAIYALQAVLSDTSSAAEPFDDSVMTSDFTGSYVLLVDDVEINREIVIALLEPTNIDIDCAENGAIAVRMVEENPFRYDMIFMDVQMPEMDGYEATRSIRSMSCENAKNVPIIAMTANVFKEDIEKCLSAGMNDHLGKPLDFNDVIGKLNEYL